jgi:hypothetical protein
MVNYDGTTKHLAIIGEVLVNPEEGSGRDRTQQKDGAMVLTLKISRRTAGTCKRIG